jgi:casein kinase 1
MFIHLLTPNGLPWTRNGIPKTDAAHERIKRAKRDARPEQLCRDLPSEFEEFLRYCRRLQFAEKPDYQKWIKEFSDLAKTNGFPAEDAFIWPPPVSLPVYTVPLQQTSFCVVNAFETSHLHLRRSRALEVLTVC